MLLFPSYYRNFRILLNRKPSDYISLFNLQKSVICSNKIYSHRPPSTLNPGSFFHHTHPVALSFKTHLAGRCSTRPPASRAGTKKFALDGKKREKKNEGRATTVERARKEEH